MSVIPLSSQSLTSFLGNLDLCSSPGRIAPTQSSLSFFIIRLKKVVERFVALNSKGLFNVKAFPAMGLSPFHLSGTVLMFWAIFFSVNT